MTDADYMEALSLLNRATSLLQECDVASRSDFLYELRRLRRAFDVWRVQVGQCPPALQRN